MKHKRLTRWTPAAILLIAGSTHSLGAGPFGAVFELSSLDGTNGFVINGIDTGDQSGVSVSSAGDVNGDGVGDLLIGAYLADPNGSYSGESYCVFGGADIGEGGSFNLFSLTGDNGFVLKGIDANDQSGRSVSAAGDINGDGFDDIIIGAQNGDPNGDNSGESYMVFGGANVGTGGVIDLSSLNGINGFVINGVTSGDNSGNPVSRAGDINGDGIDDLIIGAPQIDKSFVVFGAIGIGAGGAVELSSLNGMNGFAINGADADDSSGFSVSSAGDLNSDGVEDLIIGAPNADQSGFSSGAIYAVFGSAIIGESAVLELSSLDGENGFRINGIESFDNAGFSVSSGGDVNGDGTADALIGAFTAESIVTNAGESYVVFGGVGVGSTGALNLSALNGLNGFVISGIDDNDRSGWSVSNAGDINCDGVDDLIIGALQADPNGTNSGESYVVFGAAGIGTSGALNLSALNGLDGFIINGVGIGDLSGSSVSSAGDVNDDGIDDLIIGALNADPNGQISAGESYVIFGRALCMGDLNSDNTIDTADLGILLAQFNTPGTDADINADGVVDTADLGILLSEFNTACP